MSRSIIIVFLAFALTAPACIAADTTESTSQTTRPAKKTTAATKRDVTKDATARKTATTPMKLPKPKVARTFEAQLSGYTSEDAQQLYSRLALQETRKEQTWYVRGSLSRTKTRSGKSHTQVTTGKIDSRLEHLRSPKTYSVITGVMSSRNRDSSSNKNDRNSGYQFLSYGLGRVLGPKAKADVGLGMLQVFDDGDEGVKPALVFAIRGTQPITQTLSWDSDVMLLQPMDRLESTKIDSELGLVQSLSPGLSLRLTWTLNNLIRSLNNNREWDSGMRLVISYRHTTSIM